MNIFIIGQTSLHWGRMEFGNIGNYYIIEPFIRELHNVFPNATIKTTLQMSERFCKDEKIKVVPLELYYDFQKENNLEKAIQEINLVEEYLKTGLFREITPYIEEVLNTDIVIDFSGDIWGDNANFLGKDRFEVGLYKDMVAQKLGKPTFMLAGSPGPFKNEKTKKLAKGVFKNFTLVTNREPVSTQILQQEGFDISIVKNVACPAFLFEPKKRGGIEKILKREKLLIKDGPIVGFVICGWNFIDGPYDKWPRENKEYEIFVKAIEYISNNLDANVCLMSHSNGFRMPPAEFELIHGRDYPIIKQLQEILKDRGVAKNFFVLDGIYDPWVTKTIIGNFDMLVSGRVHAAVAGLSQAVPTVIIDYGHKPKAHKLRGFSQVANVEEFLSDPADLEDFLNKIQNCWDSREMIKDMLEKEIPHVKEQARQNFKLVKECVDNGVANEE
ncbi:MAG: polysaccharide pyruvyl transferase family protein [Dysgonamonadaceae bacterium]|nr:polysaccharide pyruvyl transferase family protein [Dysgonamonadaceae bacterium]